MKLRQVVALHKHVRYAIQPEVMRIEGESLGDNVVRRLRAVRLHLTVFFHVFQTVDDLDRVAEASRNPAS